MSQATPGKMSKAKQGLVQGFYRGIPPPYINSLDSHQYDPHTSSDRKTICFVGGIMCITEPPSTAMINPPSLIGERLSIACKLWSC